LAEESSDEEVDDEAEEPEKCVMSRDAPSDNSSKYIRLFTSRVVCHQIIMIYFAIETSKVSG
jgi:hypothetical protein